MCRHNRTLKDIREESLMKVYTLGEEAQVLMEDVVDAYVAQVSPAGGMHMGRR